MNNNELQCWNLPEGCNTFYGSPIYETNDINEEEIENWEYYIPITKENFTQRFSKEIAEANKIDEEIEYLINQKFN